jgi:hypothetical protein
MPRRDGRDLRRWGGTALGVVVAMAALPGRGSPAPGPGGVTPWSAGALAAQSWSTSRFERQVGNERTLDVVVNYGAGTFLLRPLEGGQLYQARIRFDEEVVRPLHTYADGVLRVGVETLDRGARRTALRRGGGEGELDLRLGRSVPTHLSMAFGAVRADLDLGGIALRTLDLSTGASETTVRVSQRNPGTLATATFKAGAASLDARELGRLRAREIRVEAGLGEVRLDFTGLEEPDTDVRASVGLGALEIRVPRGVGVHLTRSGLLSSLNAPDLERRGNTWVSPNWESASVRLRLDLESALGSVTLTRIP